MKLNILFICFIVFSFPGLAQEKRIVIVSPFSVLKTFSGMEVQLIPSEENIRDIRQIPFEVDPPEHKGYRDLLETWFKRPIQNETETLDDDDLKEILKKIILKEIRILFSIRPLVNIHINRVQ